MKINGWVTQSTITIEKSGSHYLDHCSSIITVVLSHRGSNGSSLSLVPVVGSQERTQVVCYHQNQSD